MPDSQQPDFEDDNEYDELLKYDISPRQRTKSFNKSPAISPSSFRQQPIGRSSNVVSPFATSASDCASQSPLPSINEEAKIFVDEHMQNKVLERWFNNLSTFFTSQVFPKFLINHLSANYTELLNAAEAAEFFQTSTRYGDFNDPTTRNIVYKAQCELLYKTLTSKIIKRPSLIYDFIAALRTNKWYPTLADMFESELNTWKKEMIDKLNGLTPAFHLPSPNRPITSTVDGPTLQQQQLNSNVLPGFIPVAASAMLVPLPRPTSLLVNLPEPLSFFVPRPKKANDLIDNLMSVSKKEKGWITLYGMGGSGKTTIAASTVRKFYELHPKVFTDGIFWLYIGKLNEKVNTCSTATTTTPSLAAAVDNQQNQLLLKMEFLAELLRPFDSNQRFLTTKFDQIQTATFRLKQHFEDHPKSLLILDDVWTTDVVENFNFNIPVLVTTRERSVVPRSFTNIVEVSIYAKDASKGSESGEVLLMDEAIALLFKCLTMPVGNELIKLEHLQENNYVQEIIRNFKGLPFCIPLIANCMEPFYNIAKDTYFGKEYKLKMENGEDLDEISTRPCFDHWKQLHANIITNNRDQLDHLGTHELVRRSIKSLEESLKVRLYDFVIFAEAVPFRVFQTLWSDLGPGADVKIMEILIKLVNKSLVIKIINTNMATGKGMGQPSSPRGKGGGSVTAPAEAASFTLHSITLAFLKQELRPDEIKERHSRLIERYIEQYCRLEIPSSHCEYDYSRLPNDQYIYHNLAYHLYSAERWSLFAPIFLNLGFATNKVQLVGPSDLLNDYIDYRRYFERADSEKLSDYHAFIASNSNILCEPNVSIIQTALNQPNTSAVRQEALELVRKLRKKEAALNRQSQNYHQYPHNYLRHQQTFFDWCNKHNCSNEAPPKFLSFKCLPEVSFATYSPDSRLIATASGRTLQIWDSTTGELVCHLDNSHSEGTTINHVVFSRSGQFLLTSADDGTAIMWQYNQWTPTKLKQQFTYSGYDSNTSSIQTHRNSRSLTVSTFDYIDSDMQVSNAASERNNLSASAHLSGSFEHLNIHGAGHHHVHSAPEADVDPLLLRQRRRRSSGNNPNSLGQQSLFTQCCTFDLKQSKLKADTIVEAKESRALSGQLANTRVRMVSGPTSLSHSIRCGDISPDNRYVLTGNSTGNLHLWIVADQQQLISPLILADEDDVDGGNYVKEVECCSFSGDSRFILGLVGNVVYIYSITDKTRSQTELNVINSNIGSTKNTRFSTPPASPSRVRRAGQVSVNLSHRLVHQYKVYNAIFHSSGSSYYPFVFTSSDKYIFEWDLDGNHAQASSFLDFDEDDSHQKSSSIHLAGIKLTQEKRKYSTTLSSQHSNSSNNSHLSFVAISRSGKRIAGFEHTRNEIYLWNRGEETANWGFGSRSPSPISGGCCPSNVLLRCQSNIVSLAFSSDNERLLGCCRLGEITVWNVGKNVSKSSIVDLKDKFAATFTDETNDETLRVLTIDSKGFLRLFTGLEGNEDDQFSEDLRQHLSAYTDFSTEKSKLMSVSPLRLDITCCDIAPLGPVIFGTNTGEVFYYQDDGANNQKKFLRTVHGSEKLLPEIVNHVHFIPGTSTKFISISDKCISFIECNYPKNSIAYKNPKFTRKSIFLDFLLDQMNKESGFSPNNNNVKIDSFKFVSKLNWLIFWSNVGHLWVFDYANSIFFHNTYLNNNQITFVDFSDVDVTDKAQRQAMVVATTSKTIYTFRIGYSSVNHKVQIDDGPKITSKFLPRSIRVARDRTFIIVGDDSGGIARCSTNTSPMGKEMWRVGNAHTAWVHDIVISPDQRYLLSASESIKLWSAFDGALLQSFMTNGSVSRLLARFSPPLDRNQNPIVEFNRNDVNVNEPMVTVVTVTDASTLYILKTLN